MKPSQLIEALPILFAAGRPFFIRGMPGLGKSSFVRQVADKMGLPMIDVRAVLLDPVDFRGLPHIDDDGRAQWAAPAFLPSEGKGVLFLDEINAAPPLVQNACLQLVLDRKIGEYTLPDGWVIAAAGNGTTDGAHVSRMTTALVSRFVNLSVEADLEDWTAWAEKRRPKPIRGEIVAYLRYRPEKLHKHDRAGNAFPCPRTWEFASDIMDQKPSATLETALISGAVGQEAAEDYVGFLRMFRGLPKLTDIFSKPATADVPTDTGMLHALVTMLPRVVKPEQMAAMVKYLSRVPDEFAVVALKSASYRKEIADTAEFKAWAANHPSVKL